MKEPYYVHNGVLFLLEKIQITKKEHYKEDGTRVREDGELISFPIGKSFMALMKIPPGLISHDLPEY